MITETLYRKLAKLAVRRGVNVQKGQPLVITASVRDHAFVQMCVKEAYEAGASYVDVEWQDQEIRKLDYAYQSVETLQTIPQDVYDAHARRNQDRACYLHVLSDDPNGMKDVDPEKITAYRIAYAKKMADLRKYTMNNEGQWSIVGLPSQEWAHTVFPSLPIDEAYEKLGEAIFMTSRVSEDTDPLDNWEKHDAELIAHAKKLNEYDFKELHFTSELGTDLTVQLASDHIWVGGGDTTPAGVYFDPNIPTEEVFGMPRRDGVNGKVFASKPLSYGGKVLKNFWFEFKDGRVEDYGPEEEKDALTKLLNFDEGSRHLGEVALVPYDSPISNSGILFFNTLYDENAACHLALGACYPENVKKGVLMSQKELAKHGANDSVQHVDFMFGTKEMNVDGITKDGKSIPVFRQGNFVF
jgi:aminopeptidase